MVDVASVEAVDGCSWRVTLGGGSGEPDGAAMELWEGVGWEHFRGVLQMPLELTVRVTGGKAGCSS